MSGAKDKVMKLLKTNPTKDYSKPKCVKKVHEGKTKPRKLKILKQSEHKIIKNIGNLFKLIIDNYLKILKPFSHKKKIIKNQ